MAVMLPFVILWAAAATPAQNCSEGQCGQALPQPPASVGNLSYALSMWIVGLRNLDQSLCGIRQWAKYKPVEWTIVLVHKGLSPEIIHMVWDEVKHQKHQILGVRSLQERLHTLRPTRLLIWLMVK